MSYSINNEPIQQRDTTSLIPSYIEVNEDSFCISNISTPTQHLTITPNKVDEFIKNFHSKSTQQEGGSLSSLEQMFSSKETQHQQTQPCNTKANELKTSHHNVQYQDPHKDRSKGVSASSNRCTQANIEQSQTHSQQMHLRRTIQLINNEDSSSNITINNLNKQKQYNKKEEDTSWSDKSTSKKVKSKNKSPTDNETHSLNEKYHSKINRCLNYL